MVESALSRPGERERYDNKLTQINWVFVGLLIMLTGIGILLLYSADGMKWDPWAYKQMISFALCLLMMLGLALIDLRVWLMGAYWAYGLSLLLLIMVEVHGSTHMGATRWLKLGPIEFQPSEFMKLSLVLALARFYHERKAEDATFSWWLLIPAAMIGIPVLLVMKQPDLGTAVLISLTGLSVMVLAGLDWKIITAGAVALVPTVFIAFKYLMHDYQRKRILTFLNPEGDPSGDGYHII